MNNPKPTPSEERVVNLVNSLGKISGSIPLPVSFMLTVTSSFPLSIFVF